ncbi:MAG: hypothetical protein PVJ84_09990 [Desulfobacteraceae bacterium]|jgi:hypothetical protein
MGEKSVKAEKDAVCIHIPKALYDRVEAYCSSNSIEPRDFIFDAVSEQLASVHRERRRKQRL